MSISRYLCLWTCYGFSMLCACANCCLSSCYCGFVCVLSFCVCVGLLGCIIILLLRYEVNLCGIMYMCTLVCRWESAYVVCGYAYCILCWWSDVSWYAFSNSIIRYLAEKYCISSHWYPAHNEDDARREKVDEYMDWSETYLKVPHIYSKHINAFIYQVLIAITYSVAETAHTHFNSNTRIFKYQPAHLHKRNTSTDSLRNVFTRCGMCTAVILSESHPWDILERTVSSL